MERVSGSVPAQMWPATVSAPAAEARQSRCRCGRAESSPGADAGGVSPVPVQMRPGCAKSWGRCGREKTEAPPTHGLEPRGDVRYTLRDLAGVRRRADLSAEWTMWRGIYMHCGMRRRRLPWCGMACRRAVHAAEGCARMRCCGIYGAMRCAQLVMHKWPCAQVGHTPAAHACLCARASFCVCVCVCGRAGGRVPDSGCTA
jgi:hypothetical protein